MFVKDLMAHLSVGTRESVWEAPALCAFLKKKYRYAGRLWVALECAARGEKERKMFLVSA